MPAAISIQGLSKRFTKVATQQPYHSLRDAIANGLRRGLQRKRSADFWALHDINLEVQQGERLGIIGRNGAGKSTLLKILSRISPPTSGRVVIEGRVASLLEVGTGFHPELTGRENIYLNGSLLGLKRHEINNRMAEIIDFSGVGDSMEMPLKQYSSGMQLRLAFSVAAHLQPEVLLIDEVLAVGDFEFQQKCLGKMEEISRTQGRTVVFVSHNMAAVKRLCNRGIVLQNGRMTFDGNIHEAANFYTTAFLQSVNKTAPGIFDLRGHPNKAAGGEGLLSVRVLVDGMQTDVVAPGAELVFEIAYQYTTQLSDPEIGIVIKSDQYQSLIGLNNKHTGTKLSFETGAVGRATIRIPTFNVFAPGEYLVDLYAGDQSNFYECLYDAFRLTVSARDVYGSGVDLRPEWNQIYFPDIQITTP